MNWLIIIVAIIVVVFIISLMSGESTSDSAANAAGAGMWVGGCFLQIFIGAISIIVIVMLFSFLFSQKSYL